MADSSRNSSGDRHTINSIGMGRLLGKNAIVTGAAGLVIAPFAYFQ
jgi:hypothetical protein